MLRQILASFPKTRVLELLAVKPDHVTVVLTGRYASENIMKKADMISEVKEVRHHFAKGIQAQPGIEY